jgi:tRNA(adenine34) deaminase
MSQSSYDAAMRRALVEADAARGEGEIPIGAVVLDGSGAVIATAHNTREASQDPTAHAEVLALREAASSLGRWRLDDCTLVVTLEPCPMCAGAATMARVDRLIFGAWNDEYGAAGSRWDLVRDRRLNHQIEVVSGVLADECGAMVRTFLADQRGSDAKEGS